MAKKLNKELKDVLNTALHKGMSTLYASKEFKQRAQDIVNSLTEEDEKNLDDLDWYVLDVMRNHLKEMPDDNTDFEWDWDEDDDDENTEEQEVNETKKNLLRGIQDKML